MSTTQTPHLGLIKPTPGTGEYADVSVINSNMDKLDAAIGEVDVTTDGSLQEQVTSIQESVNNLVICERYINGRSTQASGNRSYTHTIPKGYKLLSKSPLGPYPSGDPVAKTGDATVVDNGNGTVTVTIFVYNPNNINLAVVYSLLYIRI